MKWVGVGLLCLMVVGFARPALAQDAPKAEISGGYNWIGGESRRDEALGEVPQGVVLRHRRERDARR